MHSSVAILCVAGAFLLSVGGEHAAYDPAGFIASSYNRPIERHEHAFLETSLESASRPVRCYMLPASTEPFLGNGIEMVVIDRPDEISLGNGSRFFYVSSAQLMKPGLRKAFAGIQAQFLLEPFTKTMAGPLELALFRLRSRD